MGLPRLSAEVRYAPPGASWFNQFQEGLDATSSSEVYRVIMFLKDRYIYIFTVAIVENPLDEIDVCCAHDACYVRHTVDATASVLACDTLAAMRAGGRHMSMGI